MSVKSRQYSKAQALLRRSPEAHERAYPLLLEAMEKGDYRAHYAIATWYLHGRHLKQNLAKAVRLRRQAARHDIAEAAWDLAVCHEVGCGVPKDGAKAAAYFLQAFRLGGRGAAHALDRLFYWGIGVRKCRPLAAEFARLAGDAPRPRANPAKTLASMVKREARVSQSPNTPPVRRPR